MTDFIRLKEQFDLTALVEADLGPPRRRSGKWLLWLCPFHEDRAPSLAVTPGSQTYYCFGCGATGDTLTWLREFREMDWPEVRRMAGTDLPPSSRRHPVPAPAKSEVSEPTPGWRKAAAWIAKTCEATLWAEAGTGAREWLHRRGLTDETIRRWHLGYNPQAGAPVESYYGPKIAEFEESIRRLRVSWEAERNEQNGRK